MPLYIFFEIVLYFLILWVLMRPVGAYTYEVMQARKTGVSRYGLKLEMLIYQLSGIDINTRMTSWEYARAFFGFHLCGACVLYVILFFQNQIFFFLPPVTALPWDLAFNITISFITHTNWQAYNGETDLNMGSQVIGLMVQQFLAAGSSLCLFWVFVRGFTADAVEAVGNFWVDLVRSILYILLPFSVLLAIGLMAEGVIHNFQTYLSVETLEGHDNLKFPMGPVAAFEAIKMIGTNGGGFFFANGAHPFANPTVFSNFLQLLAMMLLPMALCYTFGRMVDDMRQAWVLLISVLGLLLFGLLIMLGSESLFMGFESDVVVESSPWAPGGNMEGKEVRFGVVGSSLFSALTTATACGATNADLSSFLGWGQWVLFLFLSTGEVIFGGAGIGFCGILGIALLTVFFVGLMLGRTPEYLRKKIEIFEVKMMALMFMVPPISLMFVLCLCIAVYYPVILKSESLSIVLYNLFSVVYNNGSAFSSGISGPFWNVLTAILMLLGRFSMVVSVIGLGYSLAQKPKLTVNPLSLSTTSALFCFLLWVVIFLMSTLSYMPFLALGPMLKLF